MYEEELTGRTITRIADVSRQGNGADVELTDDQGRVFRVTAEPDCCSEALVPCAVVRSVGRVARVEHSVYRAALARAQDVEEVDVWKGFDDAGAELWEFQISNCSNGYYGNSYGFVYPEEFTGLADRAGE